MEKLTYEQVLQMDWPEGPGLPWQRLIELHQPTTDTDAERRQALIDGLARVRRDPRC